MSPTQPPHRSDPPPGLPCPGMPNNPWGDRDWTTYYDAVAGKGPRETLLAALELVPQRKDYFTAIDLGAGEGRDTLEMLRRGYHVLALDPHPDAIRRIRAGVTDPRVGARLSLVEAGSERLPEAISGHRYFRGAAVVNASFSLPFIRPERFDGAWAAIRGALGEGGVFAGQFFGPEDSWAGIPGRSHHTRERVERLLAGLRVHQFQESRKPGHDAEGNPKHWHVFHVVAQRS